MKNEWKQTYQSDVTCPRISASPRPRPAGSTTFGRSPRASTNKVFLGGLPGEHGQFAMETAERNDSLKVDLLHFGKGRG